MSFDTASASDFPSDTKPLPAPLASVNVLTGQFSFTEYATPPTANTAYEIIINNQDLTDSAFLALFGDGVIGFQVGDPASSSTYAGTWTPTPGASHEVHFSIDALGVPTLYIDDVAVALTFVGMGPTFASLLPANSVNFLLGSGDAAPASSPIENVFITSGSVAPETVFCCP